jgi:hypothetical protein
MDRLVHDLRLAVRLVARAPLVALAVVATLGLGIGANTRDGTRDLVALRARFRSHADLAAEGAPGSIP